MSTQRLVVANVWKGLKVVSPNLTLHAATSTDYDREDIQHRRSNKFGLCSGPLSLSPVTFSDLGALSYGLPSQGFGSGSICTVYEGPTTRRLDVFPVTLDFDSSLKNEKVGKSEKNGKVGKSEEKLAICQAPSPTSKVRTVEASVQTELLNKEPAPPLSDQAGDMIDKFKGLVENEVGIELAAEDLGTEAVRSWTGAANVGNTDAIYNLAICYSKGTFVKKDLKKAISLWKKASKQGHALSTYQLAVCNIRGLGTEPDREYGTNLMKEAADAGCSQAEFFMASKLLKEGERHRSVEYLRGAIRDEKIRNDVRKWLKMRSLPADVRHIVMTSLNGHSGI